MSDESRDHILFALRQALEDQPAPAGPRFPEPPAPAQPDWPSLAREFTANGARFALARSAAEVRGALVSLARAFGVRQAVLWNHPILQRLGLADTLRQAGVEVLDPDMPAREFVQAAAECDLGVTAADALIAESATLVLMARPGQERSASLLPPIHLAVVTRETAVLPAIPDLGPWLAAQRDADGRPPSAAHCVTGPSSTADIELVKVRGVHGPTTLAVVALAAE